MKVCPKCNSARLYKRIYSAEYRCTKCNTVFKVPRSVHLPNGCSISTGVSTAVERKQRIERIRKVHEANPDYSRKELRMVCFESAYMVDRYWKEVVSKSQC